MKKLMIALATIAAAVVANASAVTWSVSNVAPTSETSDMTHYMAYLIDDAIFDHDTVTVENVMTAISKAADSAALYPTSSSNPNGKSGNVNFDDSYVSPNTATYYAIVMNDDQSKFKLSATKTATVTSQGKLSMAIGSMASYEWQAVPEPTTGLLMLLGMGALALRRRRA